MKQYSKTGREKVIVLIGRNTHEMVEFGPDEIDQARQMAGSPVEPGARIYAGTWRVCRTIATDSIAQWDALSEQEKIDRQIELWDSPVSGGEIAFHRWMGNIS